MKFSVFSFLTFVTINSDAFTIQSSSTIASESRAKTTALGATLSRKCWLEQTAAALIGGGSLIMSTPANANLLDDSGYSSLLPPDNSASTPQILQDGKRPTYLTDPTAEFRQNEEKTMIFKRKQIEQKKKFKIVIDRFLAEPNDEKKLAKDLKELQKLTIETRGLPIGIKKDELFKTIRVKKRAGFWPTSVELAYQELIREITYQQSPNVDKEMGNPF